MNGLVWALLGIVAVMGIWSAVRPQEEPEGQDWVAHSDDEDWRSRTEVRADRRRARSAPPGHAVRSVRGRRVAPRRVSRGATATATRTPW